MGLSHTVVTTSYTLVKGLLHTVVTTRYTLSQANLMITGYNKRTA